MKAVRILACIFLPLLFVEFFHHYSWSEIQGKARKDVKSSAIVEFESIPKNNISLPLSVSKIEKPTVQEISSWIEKDTYCEESAKSVRKDQRIRGDDPDRRILLYKALDLANGSDHPDSCILALLATDRSAALKHASQGEDVPCRFIRALILTDQWASSRLMEKSTLDEKKEGLTILHELAAADPRNGYFSFFELGATDPINREEVYEKFLMAEQFESPLRTLYFKLRQLGNNNFTAMMYAVEIYSAAGFPDFSLAQKLASDMAKSGVYSAEFEAWVFRLDKYLQNADRMRLSEPAVVLIEDDVRRGIALSGKNYLHQAPPILQPQSWIKYFKRVANHNNQWAALDFGTICSEFEAKAREFHPVFSQENERQMAMVRWLQ